MTVYLPRAVTVSEVTIQFRPKKKVTIQFTSDPKKKSHNPNEWNLKLPKSLSFKISLENVTAFTL